MKIVAIGATGFIGRHVVAELAGAGHEVAVVHRGSTPLKAGGRVVEILAERSTLQKSKDKFRAWSPDVVLDMILSSAPQARAILETFRGIARRVVAVSSGDVYRAMAVLHRLDPGAVEPVPLTEDSPLRTTMPAYSKEALAGVRGKFTWVDDEYDKVQVEQAIRSDPELPATILRLPMVYGPGDPLHRLFPVVKRIEDRRPAIVYERSHAQFVPCREYVGNVAHAVAMACASDAAAGRIYNVCGPDAITEADWTAKIGAITDWTGRVVAVSRDHAPKHLVQPYRFDQHLFMDSSRIRAELGYADPVSVEEALRRTVEWERSNPPQHIDPAQYDYPAEDEALART